MNKRDQYDTGVLPPGDDVGGADLPKRGQQHNRGFGATNEDRNRGHLSPGNPPMYESEHPQRGNEFGMDDISRGFINRSGFANER